MYLLLQHSLAHHGHQREKRRGLFDFIGQISKSLFGTATSDEIATLQRHMQTLNNK